MKPTIKECGGYPVVRDSMPTVLNDALTNVSGLGAIHDGFLQKRYEVTTIDTENFKFCDY